HVGAPERLPPEVASASAIAHRAVTDAWRVAARHLGEPVAPAA
ncbi:1-acyl-sn-glycerol-3-phosphate acyltransferase, partial [Streptomyces sp. NPDC005899]